ncbi:hypothetical protein SAMN05421664_1403 [Chryseobacterium soldanellicola]|uniref:Uncharacterized protein n=1 Tax=Chryseobacterium soldanellicola TaxID=311333 RepID=A0A1H1AFU4_9FLAO|nr:hypothetical protein [Chryseobacterium soldanellicola]SDQ38509.1 hypothetical protein SAMN05421664_1403 [Chryseobacterium soldanellicola]
MGIAKKCLKFVNKDGKTKIIRDNVEIISDIPSEDLGYYIDELLNDAGKQGKSWDDYLDNFIKYVTKLNYNSTLQKLNLNTKLTKQIAAETNNFKRYFFKIEQGMIKTHKGVFDSGGEYIDWIITDNNEFFIGHGHAFLSGNSNTIKNAGTAIIKEGKLISIVNGSGHYLPRPEYLDVAITHFKEINIIADEYRIFKWKPKIK